VIGTRAVTPGATNARRFAGNDGISTRPPAALAVTAQSNVQAMRLAIVSSHPIQYQVPLFRALAARRGVDLEVLFCHDHGAHAPAIDPGFGVPVRWDVPLLEGYRHRFLRNVAPRPKVSFSGLVNPELVSIVGSDRYDAVLIHGYASVSNLLALATPRRGRTRLLMRGESHLRDPRSAATQRAKQVVLPALFRRVDHFLAIGTLNRQYYEHYGVPREKITLAPYTVDNAFFASQSEPDRAATRARYHLPTDVPLFLFCAKLIPKKRPLDAVRAFAQARRAAPCALVMVGDGVLMPEVRREVAALGLERDVHLLGFRNQRELPSIYAACDALVLPSDCEPWGLVVNEAMVCGLAIAVSETVGSSVDLVTPENGAVFPVGDVAALARILTTWAQDREELARRGAASRTRIQAWGIEQTADGVLAGVAAALAS
jgi:glycosyltransferase involved in cell wall biosynthesis